MNKTNDIITFTLDRREQALLMSILDSAEFTIKTRAEYLEAHSGCEDEKFRAGIAEWPSGTQLQEMQVLIDELKDIK